LVPSAHTLYGLLKCAAMPVSSFVPSPPTLPAKCVDFSCVCAPTVFAAIVSTTALLVPFVVVTEIVRTPAAKDVIGTVSRFGLVIVGVPNEIAVPPPLNVVPPATKFVPVNERMTVEPRMADDGLTPVNVGASGDTVTDVTLKSSTLLVPELVVTETFRAPVGAVARIENIAVIDVVVGVGVATGITVIPVPLTLIVVEPGTKFDPLNVTVTAAPCPPVFGRICVSTGTVDGVVGVVGGGVITGAVTANDSAFEAGLPGLTTRTA